MKNEIIINDGQKRNFSTGREYTGKNAATLEAFEDNFFMTFNQGRALGLHLVKGSKGIALLLVDPRKSEKDGEESRYFYKRGFFVFGLSCWTKDGAPVDEPEEGAPFPWFGKPAIKEPAEPIAEKPAPVLRKETGKEVFKQLEKTVRNSSRSVNKNRAAFLKNAAAFISAGKPKVIFKISGGTAFFWADQKCLSIPGISGEFSGLVRSGEAARIIKGIDSFSDGLIGKKRICFPCEVDMPDFPIMKTIEGYVTPADIQKVVHAAATDAVKPSFHAVLVNSEVVAASDSRRLAVAPISTGPKEPALIPYALAKNAPGPVQISGRYAFGVSDFGVCSAPLVDGQFPTYKQVLPKEFGDTVIDADAAYWREMREITPAPSHKTIFTPEGTFIADIDAAGAPIQRKVGDVSCPVSFGVNAEYVADAVKDGSKIYVTGPMSPIVVVTGDTLDVIMPIQIKREDD